MAKCTYIDGIGSSQAIDTAGEVVDLKGLDISSLIGSAYNFEHESKLPSQIVGKILDAKKIFTESDCENERHRYYWDKCRLPFLYVFGRLFDDKKDSSKEVAALFRDDAEHPDEPDMVGFSVEGSKIEKVGSVVTRSIARKVTITHIPANKQCIAETIPMNETKKDELSSLFKGEVQLFAFEPSYVELLEKADAHGEPLMKPYSSDAQRRWAHTPAGKEALGGEAAVHEWDEATKGKKLPEKVKKVEKMKKDVGTGGGAFIGSQLAMSEKLEKQSPTPSPKPSPTPPPVTASGISAGFNGALGMGKSEGEKGVHQPHWPAVRGAGESVAGIHMGVLNPHSDRPQNPEKAKVEHQRVLGEMKRMPAPKLPKSEEMNKAQHESHPAGVKGVHTNVERFETDKASAGTSNVGHTVKRTGGSILGGKIPKVNVGSYPKQPGDKEYAVSEHKRVLGEMRAMPAPKLPKSEDMNKAMTAGSGLAAPGNLEGGAALIPESLERRSQKVNKLGKNEKTDWYGRADEAYQSWPDRENFRGYMKKKMPHLAGGEVDAIGRVLALKKDRQKEGALSKMFASHYTKKEDLDKTTDIMMASEDKKKKE
jgi:hypothetical protein